MLRILRQELVYGMLMLLEMLLEYLIYILRDCGASAYGARDQLNTLVILITNTYTFGSSYGKA